MLHHFYCLMPYHGTKNHREELMHMSKRIVIHIYIESYIPIIMSYVSLLLKTHISCPFVAQSYMYVRISLTNRRYQQISSV